MTGTREVYAGAGHDRTMGYRFRARIEARVRRGRTRYRWVGERKHVRWDDIGRDARGRWTPDRDKALAQANRWLDAREWSPLDDVDHEYVERA